MLGGRLHHQSEGARLVQQTRSKRQVCSNGVRNQRSEEGRTLQETQQEGSLRSSKLQHPPCPWQRCLRQARRFWDLHCLGMQNQRVRGKERTLFKAFQRESDLLCFCSNGVAARGLCCAHGARGFCSTDGCNTGAVKDGLCQKHGAKKICTFDDCTTAARSRGLCGRHGGGSTKLCDIEGCKTLAQARGRCSRHGAYGWCKVDGCTTPASQGFKHCIAHGGGKKKRPCSVAGCTTPSQRKGLCVKHGGGKEECKIAGCTNQSYGFLKTCKKHGRSGYCQHPSGCIAPATKYGANCTKHTKTEKKD